MPDPLQTRYTALAQQDACLSCSPGLRRHINLQPGQQLLELGCGQGALLRSLAEETAGVRPIGLDATPAMLEHARLLDLQGRVQWVEGNMEDLPFADISMDWVVADCSLNHSRDKLRVVREIYRVLKWGATAVIAEPVTLEPLPEAIRQDPRAQADCFGGCLTLPEWENHFAAAGFKSPVMTIMRDYEKRNVAFRSVHIMLKKENPK